MATKQRADLQKEKEKKEKIILAVLVGLLVIVGAFELPKMLKSGSSAKTAAQTTSTSPGATTTSGGVASSPATVSALPNPSSYEAGAGQLSGFSLFSGGDPFGSAVKPSSGTTTSATTSSNTNSTTSSNTNSTTTTAHGAYAGAKISVNGTSEGVLLKGTFPSASPAFVLKSVTAKQIMIGVNGGSFASGQGKVTIKKGKSVVLVNTVDSMRYVIKYVAPLTSEQLLSLISSTTPGTTSGTTSGTTVNSTTSSSTTG